jgi:hypothetical protein
MTAVAAGLTAGEPAGRLRDRGHRIDAKFAAARLDEWTQLGVVREVEPVGFALTTAAARHKVETTCRGTARVSCALGTSTARPWPTRRISFRIVGGQSSIDKLETIEGLG